MAIPFNAVNILCVGLLTVWGPRLPVKPRLFGALFLQFALIIALPAANVDDSWNQDARYAISLVICAMSGMRLLGIKHSPKQASVQLR